MCLLIIQARYLHRCHLELATFLSSLQDAETALVHFNTVLTCDSFSTFPPAYYGIGRSLYVLHRHSEALDSVRKGISFLSSFRLIELTWPGTSVDMVECHPDEVEVKD